MTDTNVIKLAQPATFADSLTEILRNGARALLTQAVETEVADFLGRHADLKTKTGHQRIVRHGHLPERKVMTGIGPVAVRQPRVRDREAVGGERIRFSPTIVPPYARRTKSLEVLIPILYLKGISTGDFEVALGALLGLVIFFMRMWLPESPRWLMTHGPAGEAERIAAGIDAAFRARGHLLDDGPLPRIRLRARRSTPLGEVAATLLRAQRRRTLVGLSLMAAQAFFYNAIFFTYALILTDFYGIRADRVGWYILPFAAGNFLGPVLLGRLFDTIGRRPMLTFTYAISGVLLAATGYLFALDLVSAATLTLCWTIIFFFASAAASAAYLTVSETFPLEIRALAIAFFYAIGTGIGGVGGPALFGWLIDTGSRWSVFGGYLLGSVLMLAVALVAARYAVAAERKPLESVARPLAAAD